MKSNISNALNVATNGRNEYLDILQTAWQQHLASRESDAPTVISLFAGCGGSSLGYSMAGYRELLAVEWDDNAVATFKLNFPDVPVYHGDIHDLSVEECMELAGLSEPGELDLLDGSPPCQGFSTAGKRRMTDLRNQLYHEYVRLLRGLQPKVFMMENVPGLVKGKMKLIFADIMKELKASGYQVKCKLLNAMYFHVPQSRQRLIWIGVRNDLKMQPSFPYAQAAPVNVSVAFQNVCNDGTAERVSSNTKIWRGMRGVKPGGYQPGHYSHRRLRCDKPAFTMQQAGGLAHYHTWHPSEHRVIMTSELKRISGYPDEFEVSDKVSNAFTVISNSVPPLFMRAIAEHIRNDILKHIAGLGLEPRLVSDQT